jgi:hypothetical protein
MQTNDMPSESVAAPCAPAIAERRPRVKQRKDGPARLLITRRRGLRQGVDTRSHGREGPPFAIVPRPAGEAPALLPMGRREWLGAPAEPYAALVRELKERYKISIRKWRNHMSGVAYELTYRDGRIKRLISAPRPRSPVSAAIFLHEVGHHAIGFRRYSPRCLEEYYVWQWVFREMKSREIPVAPRVLRHYRRSMYHYVKQARAGGQHVPHDLIHFVHWPG